MIAEARLTCGVTIALNSGPPHQVAFVFQQKKPFLDLREGILGIWDNSCLTIHGVDYKYNHWHLLEKESSLYKYMSSLIDSDYQSPLEAMQGFFQQ